MLHSAFSATFLFALTVLALPSPQPLTPDPAGAKNVGNGAAGQFIGGACLSSADCASTCCAILNGAGICSGLGAQFQAGKEGCGFGDGGNAATPPATGNGANAGTGAGTGTDAGANTGTGAGTGTNAGANTGVNTGAGTGTGTGAKARANTGVNTGAGAGTGTNAGANTGAGAGTGTNAGANTGVNTGAGAGAGTNAGANTGVNTGAGAGTGTNAGANAGANTGANNGAAGSQNIGKGDGSQFITGQCLSDADCASGCCAKPAGVCSAVAVAFDSGKQGCGFVGRA